ncbi:MAG TPA: DUF4340 domain-containing protein [Bacteroidetes bacterium]|nr:DUF4340 domain-containing protein [Bacteroidota bacterium]
MKKNYWLLLIFLFLGAATAWYMWSAKSQPHKSTLGWDRKFAVDDINQVHKIFIAKRTGETTTLTRKGDHWLVNGRYKASPNAVENVLEVLEHVTLKFVPPRPAIDHIVKEIAARGIKVEVYGKDDHPIETFYIGGVTPDARATYFIHEGSEQPMAVELPLMEGQVRTRFDFTGDFWRDRTIFDYQPDELQAVSIEYPKQRNSSFRLTRKGKGFEVKPFYENVPPIARPVENGTVEAFFVNFKKRIAESFDSEYAFKDSVKATIPFAIVSVTDTDGQEKQVTFYPYYKRDAQTGVRYTGVVERYFLDVDGKDWLLAQHRVFQKIFWPYQSFFEPAGTVVKD